jgi:tetratricopeptide (TPR) repeat protein
MTIHLRKTALLAIALLCAGVAASAASAKGDDDWKVLDSAEYSFEQREFGEALRLVDKARAIHVAKVESQRATLAKAVIPAEVKKAGDDLIAVYKVLAKRSDFAAKAVLDEIYLTKDVYFFGNSLSRLMQWLSERVEYPEADILTGKVYEAEGEYAVAVSFFKKAWEKRSYLDIPDDRFTIAYHMADIAEEQGDYGAQEEYLLLVLTGDEVYGTPGNESPTLLAMVRSVKTDPTLVKFFMLYRHDKLVALKAYKDLARHFVESGRIDRAYPAAVLAACVSMTALTKSLQAVDFQYEYTNFEDLIKRAGQQRRIVQWAKDNDIWDPFLILSSVMWEAGDREQATVLWNYLASSCPDTVVARKASGELTAHKR